MSQIAGYRAAETNRKLGWVASGASRSRYRNPDLALILPITTGTVQVSIQDPDGNIQVTQPYTGGQGIGTYNFQRLLAFLTDLVWLPSWRVAFIKIPMIWSLPSAGQPTPLSAASVAGWFDVPAALDYALEQEALLESYFTQDLSLPVGIFTPLFDPANPDVLPPQPWEAGGPNAPLLWPQTVLEMLDLIPEDPTRLTVYCAAPFSLTWQAMTSPFLFARMDATSIGGDITYRVNFLDGSVLAQSSALLAQKLLHKGICYMGYREDIANPVTRQLATGNNKVDFPWPIFQGFPAPDPPVPPAEDTLPFIPYPETSLTGTLDVPRVTVAQRLRRHLAYANTPYGQK